VNAWHGLSAAHAVWLALAVVAIELLLRLWLWGFGPRRTGRATAVWHAGAGLALLLALLEATTDARTLAILMWLALGGALHAAACLPGLRQVDTR
jgi:hypothetical protein